MQSKLQLLDNRTEAQALQNVRHGAYLSDILLSNRKGYASSGNDIKVVTYLAFGDNNILCSGAVFFKGFQQRLALFLFQIHKDEVLFNRFFDEGRLVLGLFMDRELIVFRILKRFHKQICKAFPLVSSLFLIGVLSSRILHYDYRLRSFVRWSRNGSVVRFHGLRMITTSSRSLRCFLSRPLR